ncbi:MAG TPA: PilZ domain-containing protein [Stellaceae bacterium]|nr:PilZ domain-containing protein [Stellaceae bacterium]
MAHAAHTAEAGADAKRRGQLLWSGVLQTARGPVQCLVVDISPGGARLTIGAAVAQGEAVTLMVTGKGMFRGTVAWAEPGLVGVAFAAEHSASASAA